MARPKVYDNFCLPRGVVAIVKDICADYTRRKAALSGDLPDNIRETYTRLNKAVEDALEEIEKGIRSAILSDVANGRGYDVSEATFYLAKNTYYRRKRKLIHDVAVALSLAE